MLSQASPLTADSLFCNIDFAGRDCVVAAVSGGGDSLALLFLLHDYLKTIDRAPALIAVTVDHRIRAESADEARQVGEICAAKDIAHRVLVWAGPKPQTGISAAAREARLALLADAAQEAGSDLVLTGHTADDQAETLAMRLARGGGRGTAGIAPATLCEGRVWFVRPLLQTRRRTLRQFLEQRGIAWIEDPSNRDPRFERVRVRRRLGEQEIEQLTAEAQRMSAAREKAGERAAELIAVATDRPAPGLLRVSRTAFHDADREIAIYSLRILLAVAGGTPHLPDTGRVIELFQRAEAAGGRASLSRAVVCVRGAFIYLHREGRNLPRAALSGDFVWDGRYRITARGRQRGLSVAPCGAANAPAAEIGDGVAPAGLVRTALSVEPALWKRDRYLGLATARPELAVRPVAGPWAWLLPSFDLAPANAVARVIGGNSAPSLPLQRHKRQDI